MNRVSFYRREVPCDRAGVWDCRTVVISPPTVCDICESRLECLLVEDFAQRHTRIDWFIPSPHYDFTDKSDPGFIEVRCRCFQYDYSKSGSSYYSFLSDWKKLIKGIIGKGFKGTTRGDAYTHEGLEMEFFLLTDGLSIEDFNNRTIRR
jgi:hypothetical protein